MTSQPHGRRLNVAVIFGGRSGEHEVSLASARSVVDNLDPTRYNVTLVGITKDGRWTLPQEGSRAFSEGLSSTPAVPTMIRADHDSHVLMKVIGDQLEPYEAIDVVFPVLHGPYGEDGTVQGLLELAGIPYVGAGVAASAVGMDKVLMKAVLQAAGLPVPRYMHFTVRRWQDDRQAVMEEVRECLGFPCFVKPPNLGSSVGISKVHDAQELAPAIDLAAQYDTKVMVEQAVPEAREIECSVLGNDQPCASVLGEVIPSREFYSYEAKYLDDSSQLIIPASLPEDVTERIRQMALTAFRAIDCAGMARVDFLVTRHTHEIFVSEINTIPGFTKISMYPKLWEASGLSYGQLLDRLIELALERHAQRAALKTSYL